MNVSPFSSASSSLCLKCWLTRSNPQYSIRSLSNSVCHLNASAFARSKNDKSSDTLQFDEKQDKSFGSYNRLPIEIESKTAQANISPEPATKSHSQSKNADSKNGLRIVKYIDTQQSNRLPQNQNIFERPKTTVFEERLADPNGSLYGWQAQRVARDRRLPASKPPNIRKQSDIGFRNEQHMPSYPVGEDRFQRRPRNVVVNPVPTHREWSRFDQPFPRSDVRSGIVTEKPRTPRDVWGANIGATPSRNSKPPSINPFASTRFNNSHQDSNWRSAKNRSVDGTSERYKRLMDRVDSGSGIRSPNSKGRDKRGDYAQEGERHGFSMPLIGQDVKSRKQMEKRAERERQAKADLEKNGPLHLRITIPPFISLTNLAVLLRVRQNELMQRIKTDQLLNNTEFDYVINAEDATLIALEYGFFPTTDKSAVDLAPSPLPKDENAYQSRPPIVTIMGHVDHGKTTILDYLRKSSIAAGEHGGITQHIGAFVVPLSSGKTITFLDTPGHAAFLSMRQRGANVTDIVVLVVAADDSVMPQTLEAIKHSRAAKVPVIVAVNKIDKYEANLDRVKSDLVNAGIEIEEYGGDTQVIPVSGKSGTGMSELEDAIITLSEMLELKAPKEDVAHGTIIEVSNKHYGKAATVLVTRGTLQPGHIIVAGRAWARVRSLRDEFGTSVQAAGPGTPVEVDGWRLQPHPGDVVIQATNEQQAAAVMRTRDALAEQMKNAQDLDAINVSRQEQREYSAEMAARQAAIGKPLRHGRKANPLHGERLVEGAFVDRSAGLNPSENTAKEVSLIVKADVQGSNEAVVNIVSGLGNKEVYTRIISSTVGSPTENDIELANVAGGIVLAFNCPVEPRVSSLAESLGVEIISESIIYRVAEQVKERLEALLEPTVTLRVTGEATIAQIFSYSVKDGATIPIAGCKVKTGVINRKSKVRIRRNGNEIFEGNLASLKHVKRDIDTAKKDSECGMAFEQFSTFEVGDLVQCYEKVIQKRKLP